MKKVAATAVTPAQVSTPPSPRSVASQCSWLPAVEQEVVELVSLDTHFSHTMVPDPSKRMAEAVPFEERHSLVQNPICSQHSKIL